MERKRGRFERDLVAVIFVALLVCSTSAFGAATMFVPDDFTTIQAGIDAAVDGDTVVVRDGTYSGAGNVNLDFKGKAITLRSEHGPEHCVIDGRGTSRGFIFHRGESSGAMLSGFTISNGSGGGSQGNGNGGGILCRSASPVIVNCIITGNRAAKGGGIHCQSSSPIITNCTVAGNSALKGGGLFCESSFPDISNSIFWGNGADGIFEEDSAANVAFSDVQGGHEGIGNIDADPMFVDPEGWDFALGPASPCIDAGENGAPALQLAVSSGCSRIVNDVVDMGAIEYDTLSALTKPVVLTYLINNDAATTASRTVTLNNTVLGSPTQYMASESSSFTNASWKTYSNVPQFILSQNNGDKTVYFKVRNSAGESTIKVDTITLKIPPKPTVSSFQIDNGASSTTSRTVTLNNTATGSPTHYKASESSDLSGASWKEYSKAPTFTLSSGNGTKTVYFMVKNSTGPSTSVSDTITLKSPPKPAVTSFQINNGASKATTRSVTLNNTATGSPTHYMASEHSDFSGASWKAYSQAPSFTLSSGNGEKTVYFKVKNSSGPSSKVSDTITLDVPPKPAVSSFQINNGASSTATRSVTLNNTATGSPTHYMASEHSDFSGASWKAYSQAPSFTLSSGNGAKTVYFKVKNSSGQSSTVVSDSITLNEGTDVTGTWSGKWKSDSGDSGFLVLRFTQSGSTLSGSMDLGNTDCGNVYNIPLTGTINNNVITVNASHTCDGTKGNLKYTNGIVSGNTINGDYALYIGSDLYDSGTYSATKQ